MMDNRIVAIISLITGFVVCWIFFRPEVTERIEYRETTKIDSTYKELYLELQMEVSGKDESLNDSIEYYQDLYRQELGNIKLVPDTVFKDKPFIAPLRRFNGSKAHLYGNTRYNALVAGDLLDIKIYSDFKIPEITNTITRTETRTIIQKPKGLYIEGGISSAFNYKIGATYLNDRSLVGVDYQPDLKVIWLRTGFKIL